MILRRPARSIGSVHRFHTGAARKRPVADGTHVARNRDLFQAAHIREGSGSDRDDIQVAFLKRDGSILRKSYSLTKIGKGRVDMDVKLPPGTTIFVPYANY